MKIGYPCINRSIGCSAAGTFRLASYSPGRFRETLAGNLACLNRILEYNRAQGLLFFRISSDLVPFASHPVCRVDWRAEFAQELRSLGALIRGAGMRISMHPDQFVLLNALKDAIVRSSVAELLYHCAVLDGMELPRTAKVQIHVGGIYNDKTAAMERFVKEYLRLSSSVKKRLVIENDDRLFSLQDCLRIHAQTGIPVLFDSFHHECLNNGESVAEALRAAARTWREEDGVLMLDYSQQAPGKQKGAHRDSIRIPAFRAFLESTRGTEFDIMLEIKDKEKSALRARKEI